MSCLAWSCLVAAAATAATAAGSAGPAAAVAAAYLGREPIGLRLCLAREACLFVWTASVLAPVSLVFFGWSLHFDCSCGETCVPLRFSTKSFKII